MSELEDQELGVVGLATMGMNLARNLASHGVRVGVYNRTRQRTDEFMAKYGDDGAFKPAATLEELVHILAPPRAILLMVKAGSPVDEGIDSLTALLEPGDTIIDGGNSLFHDTRRRATAAARAGLGFLGMGVSGGEEGALRGPSLMPGGTRESYEHVQEMLTAIAAEVDGVPCCTYIGADGAGHFVKMVHNGIEYGLMQAYAEGLDIFKNASSKELPEELRYDLNIADITEVWRRGSVVSSWLLDLTAQALVSDPHLEKFGGKVSDSGEGRWTVAAANDVGVPAHVLTAALFERFASRGLDLFQNKVLSAMRFGFGGHVEKK